MVVNPFGLAEEKPTIAVAGATGDLGTRLTTAFLSPELRGRLEGFVSLTRRQTPTTEQWKALGAEIRTIDEKSDENDLIMALDGVNVLVNAISTAGASLRDNLVRVLPKTSVKLYFPSEFGVDHTLHDFNVPEWDGKKKHFAFTKEVINGTNIQVCRLFTGLFLHSGIAPWYGFHTSKDVYQAVGSLDQSVSYTDISDIARVICSLAERAVQGYKVREELRIAGTHSSFRKTAAIMTAAGAGEIDLRSVELQNFKDKALGRAYQDRSAIVCLRFIMGDRRGDYRPMNEGGQGNDNENVNPGQKNFVWKTVEQLATETKGRPNADA